MYRNWRDHQSAEKVNPIAAERFPLEILKEMQNNSLRSRGVTAKANGHRVRQKTWRKSPTTGYQKGLRFSPASYGSIHRQCSAYVHSDVRSIQSRIQQTPEGLVEIRRDSKESCGRLMYAANFLMLTTCFMVSGTFYGKKIHFPMGMLSSC